MGNRKNWKTIGKKAKASTKPAPSNEFRITVKRHIHEGKLYFSGDPITLDNPATIDKLRAKGIIV